MAVDHGGHIYKIDLYFSTSKQNYSKAINSVSIQMGMGDLLSQIIINLDMSREEFDKVIQPSRDKISIAIKTVSQSDYNHNSGKILDFYKGELVCLEEQEIDNTLEKNPKQNNAPNRYVLYCVDKKNLYNIRTRITNQYFYHKSRQEILNSLPINLNIVSPIKKSTEEVIEQLWIPTSLAYESVYYTLDKLALFNKPYILFYNLFSNKLTVGDVVKQKEKPITIKYLSSIKSIKDYEKVISGLKTKFDFVVTSPIIFSKPIMSKVYKNSTIFHYTFQPYDTLFHKEIKTLRQEFYKNEEDIISNLYYAKRGDTRAQIKKVHVPEYPVMKYGSFLYENANNKKRCNENYDKAYIGSMYNKTYELKIISSWKTNIKLLTYPGRKVHFSTDQKKMGNSGYYYLYDSIISFQKNNTTMENQYVFNCIVSMTLRCGTFIPN